MKDLLPEVNLKRLTSRSRSHCLCCYKTNGFCTVLLTISNYLPVRAKGNKFPHIQQGYIINRTPASFDGN